MRVSTSKYTDRTLPDRVHFTHSRIPHVDPGRNGNITLIKLGSSIPSSLSSIPQGLHLKLGAFYQFLRFHLIGLQNAKERQSKSLPPAGWCLPGALLTPPSPHKSGGPIALREATSFFTPLLLWQISRASGRASRRAVHSCSLLPPWGLPALSCAGSSPAQTEPDLAAMALHVWPVPGKVNWRLDPILGSDDGVLRKIGPPSGDPLGPLDAHQANAGSCCHDPAYLASPGRGKEK
jgi:hypothetical protein